MNTTEDREASAIEDVIECGVIDRHQPVYIGNRSFGDYDRCSCGWTGYGHHAHLAFEVAIALDERWHS